MYAVNSPETLRVTPYDMITLSGPSGAAASVMHLTSPRKSLPSVSRARRRKSEEAIPPEVPSVPGTADDECCTYTTCVIFGAGYCLPRVGMRLPTRAITHAST